MANSTQALGNLLCVILVVVFLLAQLMKLPANGHIIFRLVADDLHDSSDSGERSLPLSHDCLRSSNERFVFSANFVERYYCGSASFIAGCYSFQLRSGLIVIVIPSSPS